MGYDAMSFDDCRRYIAPEIIELKRGRGWLGKDVNDQGPHLLVADVNVLVHLNAFL
jgi:hypothetical protein